jgi:GNAT superfamily N-acetyltransferase
MNIDRIEQLDERQVADLHALYQSEWWTKGRALEDVRRMLAGSDVVIGYLESDTGRLVAFARVLTDFVYKALVLDVIVAASHRGRGLGGTLMTAVLEHPKLKDVRHFELYCLPEMMPFYEQWGFTDDTGGVRFMRLVRTQSKPSHQ